MKRPDFDSQFQKLNNINLTEQESSESYKNILSRINMANKRRKFPFIFNRIFTTVATIIVLIAAGWTLNDMLDPSNNQSEDRTPSVVANDEKEEQVSPEANLDDESLSADNTGSCVDSNVEPTSNSIVVYFECQKFEEHLHPVKAVIRESDKEDTVEGKIEYAIRELLKGPTKEEVEKGFGSIFNEETANLLNRIELQDSGNLIVNFIDFSNIIPNGSASAASFSMMETLNTTIAQFDEVNTVSYHFDGSCEDFYAWIQVGDCMSHELDEYQINLSQSSPKYLANNESELSDLDFETAYEICVDALTKYYKAIWNGSDIQLDTFIDNDNLKEYTYKKIQYQHDIYANYTKNSVQDMEIGAWEVKYIDNVDGGYLYLHIPAEIKQSTGGYGEATEFLVSNLNGKLVIVDWYNGGKDSYDFIVRGEDVTIDNPTIWNDSEWVKKLTSKQNEFSGSIR